MKVRSHIGLLVAAVLVPVVLFSALVLNFLIAAEKQAVLRSMQELARATVLIMDKEMAMAMVSAQFLSTSRSLAKGDFADFYKQAKLANAGRETNAAFIDATGQQLFNTIVPFGTKISPPSGITQKRVRDVLAANKPVYSNLIKGSTTKKYVVAVEFPVQTNDGRRFLVDEWLFVSRLNDILPKKNIPKSWLISVFDREAVTIARNMGAEEYVGQLPREKQKKMVLSGFEGISRGYVREGTEMYGAWSRSSLSGWAVGIGVPVSEVEYTAVRSVALTALGFLFAILIAVIGAILFSRRLVGAIDKASKSANLLGHRKVPPIEDLRVEEMNQLQVSLHQAGTLLLESETARVRHLEEAEKARAIAEQAQAAAEAQNRAKDEFLAMLGHELRNPLAAISAGISLLNQDETSPELSVRAREIIDRQSQHLGKMVDELLDAHRVVSGKITLAKKAILLNEAVHACLEAFETQGVTQKYVVSVTAEPACIDADPTRLEQIINNLLENAFKYTPEGGKVDVKVGIENSDAILVVRDSGIGITPEFLPKIFDVFVQGPVTNRAKGGLGIGLAVVHALVKEHGATITVDSRGQNCGSTFTIRFPRSSSTAQSSTTETAHTAYTALDILVIEDNDDVREMLCAQLAMSGHKVASAATGHVGIAKAKASPPNIAIVDIDLPDMLGYDIALQLRADMLTAGMTLIAVTGYGQEADKEKALNSGFDFHLKKPVVLNDLMAIMEPHATAK